MNQPEPTARQLQIMEWLLEKQYLSIDHLAGRLGVSGMTVHRDLDALATRGWVRKVRGGVRLSSVGNGLIVEAPRSCVMCGRVVGTRTAWSTTSAAGERWEACCAHCGLLEMQHAADSISALATDFIYGRMVNVYQASYVIGSDITLCCAPSTLCFATRADAERFQIAFGGEVYDFAEALSTMAAMHSSHFGDDEPSSRHTL